MLCHDRTIAAAAPKSKGKGRALGAGRTGEIPKRQHWEAAAGLFETPLA